MRDVDLDYLLSDEAAESACPWEQLMDIATQRDFDPFATAAREGVGIRLVYGEPPRTVGEMVERRSPGYPQP